MRNTIKLFLIITLFLICINLASATDPQFTYQKNQAIPLKIPCLNAEQYCSNTATCSITLINPYGATAINNQTMTITDGFPTYTIPSNNVSTIGEYKASVLCNDNGQVGSSQFSILITDENPTYDNTLAVVIGIAVTIFLLLYIAFNVDKDDHFLLKILLLFLAVSMIPFIPKSIIWGQDTLKGFLSMTIWIWRIFWVYMFIYFLYKFYIWMGGKPLIGLKKQ